MHGTLDDTFPRQHSTSFDPPEPSAEPSAPLVFHQAAQGGGRFVLFAVLLPAVIALMVPFWLVVVQLATDPAAQAVLAARPQLGVQLGLGLLVLVWIFGWPLSHLVYRGLERRRITIADGRVRSEAVGPFGQRVWEEPLASYEGLAHRVRTSLSGVCHELVLVHRRPSRAVILTSSSQIPEEAVSAMARLFAVAEIPSREAASFTPLHGYFRLAEPQPHLAAA